MKVIQLFSFVFMMICVTIKGSGAQSLEEPLNIRIAYLKVARPIKPTLSNLDSIAQDLGKAGFLLGINDNNTSGKFLNHNYLAHSFLIKDIKTELEDVISRLDKLSINYILVDADLVDLQIITTMLPDHMLLFNVATEDDVLRGQECDARVFHTIPSYQMRSDALMQFFIMKKWIKIAIIQGPNPRDISFGKALRVSAKKFRVKIISEKDWDFDADVRRSAAAEVPIFTQELGAYDVLVIADETNDFARYILYNTWLPRPVFGGDGLRSGAWFSVVEQWGAAQLQSRFLDLANRDMHSIDYAAWVAIRSIGEAVTRVNSAKISIVRDYLLSPEFELGGFKGRALSYRDWNGQLRQPIALAHGSALVASAPIEGFLHEHNSLDSLGLDFGNSTCTKYRKNND